MKTVNIAWIAGGLLVAVLLPGLASLAETAETAALPALGPLPPLEAPDPGQVELGKLLFFDVRLSGDASLACASCHKPEHGWADGEELSLAYPGSKYFRNAQSVLNMARWPRRP